MPFAYVNLAQASSSQNPNSLPPNSYYCGGYSHNSHGGGRNRGDHGRGRGRNGRGDRPTCQLCRKYRHDAFNCWNRFDRNFVQPAPPPSPNNNQAPRNSQVPQWQQSQSRNFQPSAFVASQQPPLAPMTSEFLVPHSHDVQAWYPDSGASHHVTVDPQNLSHQSSHYFHWNRTNPNG